MPEQTSKSWVLPAVAHLSLLLAAPFWLMVIVFSPLVFTGDVGVNPGSVLVFVIYLSGPVTSLALLVAIWYALYRQLPGRVKVLSWCLIAVQVGAVFIFLLS
ncbi:hypothetical protein FKG94_16660 [Exilibacterium tricleocarpae]|uniref:Uncharacterized protein n=1 Tax=Exilibacterium tricleocarpae TaxID=2591008 RepID=A0A545TAK4_9GAMM|nr:hypothetical protein [Exilibacterium tricleocarpae]TQV74237.1 hypothetical protein FKG94_16660 [Exilibacterium tricleocarpae]